MLNSIPKITTFVYDYLKVNSINWLCQIFEFHTTIVPTFDSLLRTENSQKRTYRTMPFSASFLSKQQKHIFYRVKCMLLPCKRYAFSSRKSPFYSLFDMLLLEHVTLKAHFFTHFAKSKNIRLCISASDAPLRHYTLSMAYVSTHFILRHQNEFSKMRKKRTILSLT